MSAPAHRPTEEIPTCWVVSDGKAGMETQCLGLAEAMGLKADVKRIQVTRPWRWLPPQWVPHPLEKLGPKGDKLSPPWPDIIIASGRQSITSNITIKQLSGGRTFTIQIQNPVVDGRHFDLIVTPRHDRLDGPNVVASLGAMGRVTPDLLTAEAARFTDRFAPLPRPRVAVLIGGSNKVYRLTEAIMTDLADKLAGLAAQGAGLMITPSRRTGPELESILRKRLEGPNADIWDGQGDNPYFAMLGLADYVVVTCDSINMVSEAAGTGKPVFLVTLDGGSAKFSRFHKSMAEAGITRPFTGELADWTYPALAETQRIAQEARRRFERHRAAL